MAAAERVRKSRRLVIFKFKPLFRRISSRAPRAVESVGETRVLHCRRGVSIKTEGETGGEMEGAEISPGPYLLKITRQRTSRCMPVSRGATCRSCHDKGEGLQASTYSD